MHQHNQPTHHPPVSLLRYSSLVTGRRAKLIIALCWLLSFGIGLTPMLGWNNGELTF